MKSAALKLTALFIGLLLLSGCSEKEQPVLPSPEPTPEPTPAVTIMDGAQRLDSGLLVLESEKGGVDSYMPIENLDGNLLLCDNSGETERFTVVDAVTGEVLASREFDTQEWWLAYQVQGEYLALHSYGGGPVTVLDSRLNTVLETPEIDIEGDKYINHDLTKVYISDYVGDITVLDLDTMEYSDFGLGYASVSTISSVGDMLTVSFAVPEQLRREYAIVNMATGSIMMNPTGARVCTLKERDGIWFGESAHSVMSYYLSDGIVTQRVTGPESTELELDIASGRLIGKNWDGVLHVFDLEGRCLSSVTLDGMSVVGHPVYSEYWGGYFLSLSDFYTESCLAFWDASTPPLCGELEFSAPHAATPEGRLEGLQELGARAVEIGERYGINVLIGDQCATEYSDLGAAQTGDYYEILDALEILDSTLSAFPEGFIRQLVCGDTERINVNLMGGIYPISEDYSYGSFAGFVDNRDGLCSVVFDIYQISEANVFHEVSHIIDGRMSAASIYMDDCIYSYMGWEALQPEGFEYAYTYMDYGGEVDYDYFIDAYSTTFPTEDRARIFEYAATGWDYAFEGCGGLVAKLDYYCRCIRSCFDTTGWPELTPWESTLQRVRMGG